MITPLGSCRFCLLGFSQAYLDLTLVQSYMNPTMVRLDPIVLFFLLGWLASSMKSDLKVPDQVSQFLSLFLLLSIGLKGGHAVASAENLDGFWTLVLVGIGSCVLIPLSVFALLRARLGESNASALAAAYGSVSAMTFIAAQSLLRREGIEVSGFTIALMAIMEIPGIVVALLLMNTRGSRTARRRDQMMRVLSGKSVVLLLGGFIIGSVMDLQSWTLVKPVFYESFQGALAIFLLDLGLLAQKEMRELLRLGWTSLLVGFALPLLHGSLVLLVAWALNVSMGDAIILGVLAGSASYIAAPAAVRAALPQATPSLYVSIPIGLTFPFNVVLGIPYYIYLAQSLFH